MIGKTFKYKFYIIVYFLIFFGTLVYPDILRREILLVYLVLVSIYEFKFLISNIKTVKLFVYLGICSITTFVLRDSYNNASLSLYFMFYPVLLLAYQKKHIGANVQLILLLLYSFFVLSHIISGGDANEIFEERSRNIVSFYALVLVVHYYIEKYRYDAKIPFWPALLSMIISLSSIGRAGILTSALLLLFILLMKLRRLNFFSSIRYGFILIITSLISVAFGLQYVISSFLDSSLFKVRDRGIDDPARALVVKTYLNDMTKNISNLVLGVPLDRNTVYSSLNYNLHNSFLNMHYYFGIFSVVILYYIFKAFLKKGGDIFYKGLLLMLLLRGISDKLFFTGFNDVLIFYLIFLILDNKKDRNNYNLVDKKLLIKEKRV